METGVKSELTETLKQVHEEVTSLKAALSEKEFAMQTLICTHEKSKTTLKEQISKLEAEKRDLVSSLDEANLIREEREGAVGVCREEIQQLRLLLAESQKKCKETEEWAHSGKEAKFKEQLLVQFEEERNKVENQLKWKCEQFAHLEEAHKKQQSEFKELKREKEAEKLEFFGKISDLESHLDEKTRLAEDLRTHLEICNQVLAREESKRKLLEVELHESRDQYNSLVTDFEAAKSAVESVTAKRDEEIASLRGILADKSLQIKELEFEKAHNEQENQELRASLKEYREVEIGGVEKSKKYRVLEKAHKGCADKIRKRDVQIDNLKRDLDETEVLVEKLQNELEAKEKVEEIEIENLKRDEVNNLRKREEALLVEREMLIGELKEKNDLVKQVKEFIVREEDLVRENDRLICEVREREGVIKQLNTLVKEKEMLFGEVREREGIADQLRECKDREEALVRENDRLICEVREREGVVKQLNTLVKEKEMLLGEVREREGIADQLRECKEREETLVRENDRLICEVREREGVIKELNTLVKEKEMLFGEVREREGIADQLRKCKEREEALVRENDRLICEVGEREGVIKQLNTLVKEKEMLFGEVREREGIADQLRECKEREEALVRENDRLICEVREREGVVKQLNTLVKEKEMLLGEVREREGIADQLRECKEREETLVRENDRLICEVREREGVIKELNTLVKEKEMLFGEVREREGIADQLRECKEREETLVRENDRLICEVKERELVIKELNTLVKEKEMLIGEVRERGRIAEQLRECKEREQVLVREKEMLICEIREREGLIEELRGENSRLESEVCSFEEEKAKFVEIRNEMAKKLLEIKFKLDPLKEKCTEFAKEKRNEVSGLEMNLEFLVEELENSISEKEKLQFELQEMATNYFLQKHEIEFREGLFCDLEMEMDRFEDQLERERLENEAKRVRFSNDIKRLMREKETLVLQIHELNCGIGSLLCADGETKAISERILQKMRNEGEFMHEKKCKSLVPHFGTRSPLKENNF
ncbi:hypothetical protein FCM35_KLT10600 [Carex littledalei]|uniref:Uncharacterized protein n=1 Tax=Carex littledalei TaxID=544730 RepID=A0A833VJ05_9POAL|nr:hypothetical protein FCM35_KLT10600 [Carex littledalei]